MAQFQYGKAISDSFKLIFSNLHVFVPQLLLSIVSLLFMPFYFRLIGAGGKPDMGFFIANLIWIAIFGIAVIILTYIAYGWTFALIGQIVKKGKADLWKELKNAREKGVTLFLTTLIIILILIFLMILFIFLMVIGNPIAALFAVVLVIAVIVLALSLLYIAPLIALGNLGPLDLIKASFNHFRDNKSHTLALFGILVFFGIISTIAMYAVLFLFIGSFSNEALALYMLERPFKYSAASFFSGLPSLIITLWSFAFLTIAYARKKSKK